MLFSLSLCPSRCFRAYLTHHIYQLNNALLQFRPAVNTIILPSNDDVYFEKRLRIQKLLTLYGLEEKVIPGDGNCQFASLSDQLYRTPKKHLHVRKNIVAYLSRNARDFAHVS
eukprot:TRINITY_DN4374_c1_g1_i1.p1 TRINITY_DN4374_c1_g1~~TRINITY_DN4374_c1_g1_i1.p1  ORF type:complete len:113 (+),score=20.30 TRINITY_DN4374_c1_g1_i1:358-696(+)